MDEETLAIEWLYWTVAVLYWLNALPEVGRRLWWSGCLISTLSWWCFGHFTVVRDATNHLGMYSDIISPKNPAET